MIFDVSRKGEDGWHSRQPIPFKVTTIFFFISLRMSQPEEAFEETAPLASEIPPQYEEESSKCLWQSLRNREISFRVLLGTFLLTYTFVFFILFLVYFINILVDDNKREISEGIPYYFTSISCSILGLVCFIFICVYSRPVVVKVEMGSIPMEDLSRKNDTTKR
ncbi:hypothetical protein SPOG_03272 [Schizosaccharomyces cryophilus OY26]|uniref:Uncharacterized protein n=1 Tax=Schizosaccharomyces cryophilus (strain OY26 / ATCC MYA-4695 / CBS 11777 / NBRC 106824 / NRRL Y48691) TaxID=653667 RepID=S9X7N3_SCHCR|nr:uncharacterized protein SPOG_03272 [Schizosaccharomyces cryophilus OY26]EPY49796.1 hypothetical protein SPOG_03272 [Schizosaccharomyces cryophilus OY26]